MDRRQLIGAGAALVGVSAMGYAFLAPVSDEELARRLLADLANSLSFSEPIGNVIFHGSRLSESFDDIFTENVQIRIADVHGRIPSDRGKLGLVAAQVMSGYGSLDVSFSLDELEVQGDSASCRATATVAANSSGQHRRDSRSVRFNLVRGESGFQIQEAIVARED